MPVPTNLVVATKADASPARERWLASLAARVRHLAQLWSLEVGDPFQPGGQTAWVAPARTSAGADVVLKVGWRHPEAEHEADALHVWNGQGVVRLHAREVLDDSVALMLERCAPGATLALQPERVQDVVIASLLKRLWIPEPVDQPFRRLQEMCDAWADEFEAKARTRRPNLDLGLMREGIELFRSLPGSADRTVVLFTDLHAENVLAATREPWLAIDPKPYVGDPTYDVLQHLLNCEGRLEADPHGLVQRMAGLLDLDAERIRLWLFARCIQESLEWPNLSDVARRIAP